MGYWEEKAEYEASKDIEGSSKEFSCVRLLNIHPKHIKEVYNYIIKHNQSVQEIIIEEKKPTFYHSIVSSNGLKWDETLRLEGIKNKIKLSSHLKIKTWFRYFTKEALVDLEEQMDRIIKELYSLFDVKPENKSGKKYCHDCCSELKDSAIFCHNCGIKVKNPN